MNSIFCIGSINIDFYSSGKDNSLPPRTYLGGSACNTAYFLARLIASSCLKENLSVHLLGLLGADENGKIAGNLLKERGFTIENLGIVSKPTGTTEITLDNNGERTIKRKKSVTAQDFQEYLLSPKIQNLFKSHKFPLYHMKSDGGSHIVLSALGFEIFSSDISGFLTENDLKGFVDEKIPPEKKVKIRILLGNEEEFQCLTEFLLKLAPSAYRKYETEIETDIEINVEPPSAIKSLIHNTKIAMKFFRSEIACIKRGSEGGICISKDGIYYSSALPVKVVDTTGAGDAFNAGFIFAQLCNYPLDVSLKYACILGSMNCTAYGGQNIEIDEEKIKSHLSNLK